MVTCNKYLALTLQHAALRTAVSLDSSRCCMYWYCGNERKEWLKYYLTIIFTHNCVYFISVAITRLMSIIYQHFHIFLILPISLIFTHLVTIYIISRGLF